MSWQWYTLNSGLWLSLKGREGNEIRVGYIVGFKWVCQVLFLKLGGGWDVSLILFTSSGFLKHLILLKAPHRSAFPSTWAKQRLAHHLWNTLPSIDHGWDWVSKNIHFRWNNEDCSEDSIVEKCEAAQIYNLGPYSTTLKNSLSMDSMLLPSAWSQRSRDTDFQNRARFGFEFCPCHFLAWVSSPVKWS